MAGSHEKLPKLFWIQVALVLIVGTLYLLAPSSKKHENSANATGENSPPHSAATNLKLIGKVETNAPAASTTSGVTNNATNEVTKKNDAVTATKASAKKGRTGEQIFNSVCSTCHNTGIANAPKITDKAAWQPRVANGLGELIKIASTGKGAMPPRGGAADISDEELKATILYMTQKAGFDLSSTKNSTSDKTETTKQKPSSTHSTGAAPNAPNVVSAPVAPSPPKAPEAPPVMSAADNNMQANKQQMSGDTLKKGKAVYHQTCFACHDSGVAGAPKLSDKENWKPRLASGKQALYHSALNGKGVMPPKGGNTSLSDDAIKAAVDYMAATAAGQ